MKRILFFLGLVLCHTGNAQTITTNAAPVGWEHNVLFNAATRYKVSTQGPVVSLPMLFDGSMNPYYASGVTPDNPIVVLVEDLPNYHTQKGAWVGWTTRYLPANRFKIEGYDAYNGVNVWRVIADYSTVDYNKGDFVSAIPVGGAYTKLKFTFYNGQGGNVGISELFFVHPEATTPYAGLLSPALNNWKTAGTNVVFTSGNVGIGTAAPKNLLDVKGTMHAQEVKVDMENWSDFVFKKEYHLPTLEEVERHITEKGHLADIPNEEEVLKNGINLGEMNARLLQKIEELTLYIIDLNKKVNDLQVNNTKILQENKLLLEKVASQRKF